MTVSFVLWFAGKVDRGQENSLGRISGPREEDIRRVAALQDGGVTHVTFEEARPSCLTKPSAGYGGSRLITDLMLPATRLLLRHFRGTWCVELLGT